MCVSNVGGLGSVRESTPWWDSKSFIATVALSKVNEKCGRNSIQQNCPICHGWEISHPGHNLAVPAGKGVAIPSSGEYTEIFSQMALLGMVCVGVYSIYAQFINQYQKAIVIQKQILYVDNNWRNTEICHRSGSVRHADARWSLRRVSWDKEFTPYALNLNIWFIATGLYKAKQSKFQRIQCI